MKELPGQIFHGEVEAGEAAVRQSGLHLDADALVLTATQHLGGVGGSGSQIRLNDFPQGGACRRSGNHQRGAHGQNGRSPAGQIGTADGMFRRLKHLLPHVRTEAQAVQSPVQGLSHVMLLHNTTPSAWA